ncbi:MAG: xanthine dehydrogenase family protein subunit M [Deltaproteobacteria bacterium]|nr:xanthine dehydrogenase family protein subunit M [Deltaproteobacteria bacterium]
MSLPHFEYFAPRTIEEAVALLAGAGGRARPFAGGTDLLPRLQSGLVRAETLVDLKRIPELCAIGFDPASGLTIGAAVRLADLLDSPDVQRRYPAMTDAVSQTATVQIRNMGTIAGNVCNGSPCADSVPVLIARLAHLALMSPRGERLLPIGDFFKGPGETALEPDELLVRIHVPPPPPYTGFAFAKLPARTASDISAVNVGVMVARQGGVCGEARIVLGAVGPVPLRAHQAELRLAGATLGARLLEEVGRLAASETRPIDDLRASAAYRRDMAAVLVRRALVVAATRAGLAVADAAPAGDATGASE